MMTNVPIIIIGFTILALRGTLEELPCTWGKLLINVDGTFSFDLFVFNKLK